MAFNSNTYHMNKARHQARDYLDQAREIKARANKGDAYEWELPRIATFAKLARLEMRIFLSMRRVREIERAEKAVSRPGRR